jgi:hypothetical protein
VTAVEVVRNVAAMRVAKTSVPRENAPNESPARNAKRVQHGKQGRIEKHGPREANPTIALPDVLRASKTRNSRKASGVVRGHRELPRNSRTFPRGKRRLSLWHCELLPKTMRGARKIAVAPAVTMVVEAKVGIVDHHGTAARGTAARETVAHETVAHETVAHETVAYETADRETVDRETVDRETVEVVMEDETASEIPVLVGIVVPVKAAAAEKAAVRVKSVEVPVKVSATAKVAVGVKAVAARNPAALEKPRWWTRRRWTRRRWTRRRWTRRRWRAGKRW